MRRRASCLLLVLVALVGLLSGCLRTEEKPDNNTSEEDFEATSGEGSSEDGVRVIYVGESDVSFLGQEEGLVVDVIRPADCSALLADRSVWAEGVLIFDNISPGALAPCLEEIYQGIMENGTCLILLGGRSSMGQGVTSADWGDTDPYGRWILPVVMSGELPIQSPGALAIAGKDTSLFVGVDLGLVPVDEVYQVEPSVGSIVALTAGPNVLLVWWEAGEKEGRILVWCGEASSLSRSGDGKKLLRNMVRFCAE